MQNSTLKNLDLLRDPKFYLEHLCSIKGKKPGQLTPFILKECQKDLFNTIKNYSRIILLKARQLGMCLSPDTKILTVDLKWVTLDEIKIGQEVVAVDENYPDKALFAGQWRHSRKMRTAIVESKWDVYEEAFKITMDDGIKLIATANHRFLSKVRGGSMVAWKIVDKFKIGDVIRYITKPWGESTNDDAWFGGLIDGDGSISLKSRSGCSVNIAQCTDSPVWIKMNEYVDKRGYTFRHEIDNRPKKDGGKFGNKQVGKVVINRMDELFRLIGLCRPVRFINKRWWEEKDLPGKSSGVGWSKVVSIENIGIKRMIDLQTSTKTYIAEGFVSHNSTAVAGWIYHNTIMNPGTTSALIGYNTQLTAELLDKVKTFYRSTPAELRPTVHFDSKWEMSFPRVDSKILVLPSTENVGRGYCLNNVLCTELSSWENQEEKMITLEAAVPINGKLIVESTPRGQGNHYHRLWMGDNDYVKKEYGWWWGYTKDEIEIIKRRINNPLKFAQEYGLDFLASGLSVFDNKKIQEHRKNILKVGDIVKDGDQVYKVEDVDGWRIYKKRKPDHFYVVGADVAEGLEGGDYSVGIIWDRTTGEEVAFYRRYIPADTFGKKLNDMGRIYNNALMVVEINNHGLTTITALKNLLYPSFYFRPSKMETMGQSTGDRLGWKTNRVTRPILIDDFDKAFRENVLTIHSKELLDEMTVFVYDKNGDMNAQPGFNDDCIFSGAIGLQGFKMLSSTKLEQLDYSQYLPTNFAY